MSTGWGWEQALDELTAPRLAALREAWRISPPVHKTVAAFVGYKPPAKTDFSRVSTIDQARMMVRSLGGIIPGLGKIGEVHGRPG